MIGRRLSPLYALKSAAVGGEGTFTGYASTFGGEPDSYGDIIAPGAFAATIAKHAAAGTVPALLWAHDIDEPIGRWLDMREDTHGLFVRGKLTLGTDRGRQAYELMQDQALSLSIGYTVSDWGAGSGGTRILKAVELFEASVVAIPANRNAKITSVKSFTTIREFEAAARDAFGLSPRQAKALAAGGFSALTCRDDHSDDLGDVARELRKHAENLNIVIKELPL